MKKLLITLLIIFSAIFLIISTHALLTNIGNLNSLQDLSNFGQYLGGTSGILISIIVAIAALLAYFEQRRQIQLFEHSNHKQSIENTFFQLLKYHEEIVTNMDISDAFEGHVEYNSKGRNSFKTMYRLFEDKFIENSLVDFIGNDLTVAVTPEKKEKIVNTINKSYLEFDNTFQPYLGYYFRNLYYIITLIDRDQILTDAEKRFYITMLRAHLSAYEILLLFYSSLSDRGNKNAKPLILKYHLLKHIDIFKDKLLDKENCDHMYLYEPAAYGNA